MKNEKIEVGFFKRSPWNEGKVRERLINAAKALGCVTEDEIWFGVECLRQVVELKTEVDFDDVGMVEDEYDVMYLKKNG